MQLFTVIIFVDYCNVFISYLDSHSDNTQSLQRMYWWENYIELDQEKRGGLEDSSEGVIQLIQQDANGLCD